MNEDQEIKIMSNIVKYICPTQLSAFELVEHISNEGGNVCMVMNGSSPTRCVLSDYECGKNMELFCHAGVMPSCAEDWDINYFNNAMEL
jgi:hypothetical protein